VAALQPATKTIPIVFLLVSEPIAQAQLLRLPTSTFFSANQN